MIGLSGPQNTLFHTDRRLDRAVRLGLPIGLAFSFLLVLYLTRPYPEFLLLGGLIVAYLLPPAGKESVIPVGIGLGEPWWLIASSTLVIDLCCSLFVALNLDLALRIPLLGPFIGRFMEGGRSFIEARPWLERLSFAGLIIFVIVPFQGSGGVNATILGRILGMGVAGAVGCVLIGSAVSSFGIALGAGTVLNLFRQSTALGVGALAAIALILLALVLVWRRYAQDKGF